MSSAALQAVPHQSSTVTSLSPASSPSSLQYASQPIQPGEPYYSQQSSNASPSSTAWRPTQKSSGNGASSMSAQQPHIYSPIGGAAASAPVTSRPSNSVIQTTTSNTSTYSNSPLIEYQRGVPPVAPPRTSSNQRQSGAVLAVASASDRSKRGVYTTGSSSGRMASTGDSQQDRPESSSNNNGVQANGNEGRKDDAATQGNATSKSRRRTQQSTSEAYPQKSNSTRETRPIQPSSTQNRPQVMANSSIPSPNDLSREGSEILNRLIVSKPEVDLERERARMAESKPSPEVSSGVNTSVEGQEDAARGPRSRLDHNSSSSKKEKHTRFGEYYLGNTLGEGEFGKVRMGWKQEGGVEVAIKLIRRDSVGTNSTRLAKIYREIAILREISHPNIVRLHEMVETEKHIGIILEYASGGELFDYILNHRYLKDNAARRLFAQLVSGVGYLHKKGIVHRDLKLENLLLDRNRNIIITDFGFANTFNPVDELGEDIEYGLSSREFVKKMELDKILPDGYRRGDLMQTSCGSPCYAAPELVVSDCLYTGRKVDVWSCGVILYAMLAGYLPFDDDPANPEGDNISLLYKYIVSTPLTFPEYVSPNARDLLRRILVPDPRKRADLFEVARHSWLSEYAHVVGFITSSTTTTGDIANTTVGTEELVDTPLLTRSASVREPKIPKAAVSPTGDFSRKPANVEQGAGELFSKPHKDTKRRTLQVEYVEPRSQTVRGEDPPLDASTNSHLRAKTNGPSSFVASQKVADRKDLSTEKPLPQDPPTAAMYQNSNHTRGVSSAQRLQGITPSTRSGREPSRSTSDNQFMGPLIGSSIPRPNTGGSMNSTGSGRGSVGLPTRGSYGQPVAPTVAGTNAHGRMSQPKSGKTRMISGPIPILPQDDKGLEYGQSNVGNVPIKSARMAESSRYVEPRGHKRSNTIGGISEKIFGRNVSFFGRSQQSNPEKFQEKSKKSYPPVSMSGGIGGDNPRQSMDSSRRSISFGFGRKRSGSIAGSGGTSSQKESRRFSLLPAFSLRAIGIGKDYGSSATPPDSQYFDDHGDTTGTYPEPPIVTNQDRSASGGTLDSTALTPNAHDRILGNSVQQDRRAHPATAPQRRRYTSQTQAFDGHMVNSMPQHDPSSSRLQAVAPNQSDFSLHYKSQSISQPTGRYAQGLNEYDFEDRRQPGYRGGKGVLQKNNRRFADAYEESGFGYGGNRQISGSSGAARKVMDFFRRRAKAREGDSR